MKLKYKFVTTTVGDDIVAVAVGENSQGFNSMIRLNKEAEDILKLLADDIELEELIDGLAEKYQDTSRDEITEFVNGFVEQLKGEDLLI